MRKRNFILKLVAIVCIFIMFLYYWKQYVNAENSGQKIISVSQESVAPENNFYLIMNLSAISYTKFNVEITNSQKLISTETTGTVSQMASSDVVTTFTIDKNINTLDKMGIVYSAPKTEGQINFSVKITSLDVTVDDLVDELDTLNTNISNCQTALTNLTEEMEAIVDQTSELYLNAVEQKNELEQLISDKTVEKTNLEEKIANFSKETLQDTTSINVSKSSSDTSSNVNFEQKSQNEVSNELSANMKSEMNKEMAEFKEKQQLEMDDMSDKMSQLEKTLQEANDTISLLNADTQYQGSSNNYLSNIKITGYELDKEFDKTVTDYFITVPADVTKVSVSATRDDSSASLSICGNTNLKEGENKILINVTSVSGDVRTYRVYVFKQSKEN